MIWTIDNVGVVGLGLCGMWMKWEDEGTVNAKVSWSQEGEPADLLRQLEAVTMGQLTCHYRAADVSLWAS
jgi:hypothetical protein